MYKFIAIVASTLLLAFASSCDPNRPKVEKVKGVTVEVSVCNSVRLPDTLNALIGDNMGAVSASDTARISELLRENTISEVETEFAWISVGIDGYFSLLIYKKEPVIKEMIEITDVKRYPNQPEYLQIPFRFTDQNLWRNVTAFSIGEPIVMKVNGRIICAPRVMEPIEGGKAVLVVSDDKIGTIVPGFDPEKLR